MSEALDLLHLLTVPRADDLVVGWRDGNPVRMAAWRMRVAAWRSLLARSPGHHFALYLADSLEFGAALLGAWQAGKCIYLPADTLEGTCQSLAREVDGFLGEFGAQWEPLNPDAEAADNSAPFAALTPQFIGLVVHTSGSTGAAQAIPKRMAQLAAEVATLEQLFGTACGDAEVVATVSHQHIYGLLFKLLWPLTAGRAIHARSLEFPEQLAQLLQARDCIFISSPAHLKRLPDIPGWAPAAQRLRAVFSSGGPLAAETAGETARLLGQAPVEVYGSSETGGIAWRRRDTREESWRPMPGVDWRVVGPDGLLEVRSRHLPDDSWLQLADRAESAAENCFVLLGRADRLVKFEEKRISLDGIERALAACELVAEARVLVVDGLRQRIAAFVVPSHAGRCLLAEIGKLAFNRRLVEVLSRTVERIAMPRSWRYLDALPLNAQGKTTQAGLLALLDAPEQRTRLPRQRVLEMGESRALLELTAPADLFYFEGHFPDAPVLPGVVQVDWAIACGRQYFNLPPFFKGVHGLKFQRVIGPELPVTLELVHEPHKSSLSFRMSSSEGQHSSGRILFGASDV